MRVLLTTDTVGGVWTFTKELAAGLLRRGHAVALVSFGRLPDAAQSAWARTAESLGEFVYKSSDAPLEWMQENSWAMDGAPLLEQVRASFAPDLLHSNQFCFGVLKGFDACLITAHSDVLSWAAACQPTALAETPWLRRYRTLVQKGLDGADAVIAPTAWMLGALSENFELPSIRQVIPNGRSLAPSMHAQAGLQAVTVGRLWDAAKGLHLLEGLESPLPVHVAGEVRSEQHEIAVAGSLHYAGPVAEEELFALFRRSAIYVVASLYEPFGLAPLEAALCGCAVIANDIASLREVWREGALYFSGRDDLRSLLASLCDDGALLAQARARSLARAQDLSAARMVDSYLALYERLLAELPAATSHGLVYAH